jgi:hypothetical protein
VAATAESISARVVRVFMVDLLLDGRPSN